MKNTYFIIFLLFVLSPIHGQEDKRIFSDTRVINIHSTETLKKGMLDIRIGHRFGDIGDGWSTLYGLETAADVFIGGDYGITDNLMFGVSRTKGSSSSLKMFINPYLKWKFLDENKRNHPFSASIVGEVSISTMPKSEDEGSLSNFSDFQSRLIYCSQLLLAKRLGNRLSLQLSGSYIHRNIIFDYDTSDNFFVGLAGRLKLSKVVAFIVDFNLPLNGQQSPFDNSQDDNNEPYYSPLGFGFEFDTGGHVFQVNVVNSRGIAQTDYLPNTKSNWADGEFRLGFTISRKFKI